MVRVKGWKKRRRVKSGKRKGLRWGKRDMSGRMGKGGTRGRALGGKMGEG